MFPVNVSSGTDFRRFFKNPIWSRVCVVIDFRPLHWGFVLRHHGFWCGIRARELPIVCACLPHDPSCKCSLISSLLCKIISRRGNSASVPFNSPDLSIIPRCSIQQNGGVIFHQLSCHILENVNERVCKIKFMGCQWRIRTRRAITYLLSSFKLWYVRQKSTPLNAGISIVQGSQWMGRGLPLCLFPIASFCLEERWNEDDYHPSLH